MQPSKKRKLSQTQFISKSPRLSLAQSMEVEKQVKKEIIKQSDIKFTDVDQVADVVNWNGTVYDLLANLTRGDTGAGFDGDTIRPVSLQVRIALTQAAANTGTTTWRVLIGQSRLLNTPTAANVLQDLGDVTSPLSAKFFPRRKQYKILIDRMYETDPSHQKSVCDMFYIRRNKLFPVDYDTASSNITKGDLFLLVCNDQDNASSLDNIRFYSRVIFTD